MKHTLLLLSALVGLCACDAAPQAPASTAAAPSQDQVEPAATSVAVAAKAETTPTEQDGANDPAIWIDAAAPQNSLILGSAGEGGMEIYSLDGERLQTIGGPQVTLIDVHYNFTLAGQPASLVAAYDAGASELLFYTVDEQARTLKSASANGLATGAEIEGLCFYQSPISGISYLFAAGGGYLQQWELYDNAGAVAGRQIRSIPVGLGAAYCVAQDSTSTLFYTQETVGLWKMNAEPESEAVPEPVDLAEPFGHFSGDVKGVELVEFADGSGYLLASDADVSRVLVYSLDSLEYVGAVVIGASENIDGAEESEGLAVSTLAISPAYPNGLLVIADDDNGDDHTNYKLVSWQDITTTYSLAAGTAVNPTVATAAAAIAVSPTVETEPVDSNGDAADDPAIWVHPTQPELSLIIGTQKQRGINVYDLSGKILQSRDDGRLNNVDLRYGFKLGDERIDIVTASNRTTDSINIYKVDVATRTLVDVAEGVVPTGMDDPYGLCMYRSAKSGNYFVFIDDSEGVVKQWVLKDNGNGRVNVELVRELKLDSQVEGCVADDETGNLYIGEEDVGIWKFQAEPDGGDARESVDTVADGNLTDDVEGMSLYYGADGSGYLVVSNQGADSYALYERAGDNRFLGLFHVVANETAGIDGSSETDGLDVTSANLGPAFPRGLLVAQDGRNITPEENQNFKLVPWERIATAFGLTQQTGYDPRAASAE